MEEVEHKTKFQEFNLSFGDMGRFLMRWKQKHDLFQSHDNVSACHIVDFLCCETFLCLKNLLLETLNKIKSI